MNFIKTALITGITGQDGSFLSQFLLSKGYRIIGMISAVNDIGIQNIEDFQDKLILEEGDLLDKDSIKKIIDNHKPDEIYNLAGISFIPTSWKNPALTFDVNALGPLRILEIIRDFYPKTKFFQASSAKIFDYSKNEVLDENSPFNPQDPYAVSKYSIHQSIKILRKQLNIFACCGILFNHESEKRGPEFVTRKITQAAAKIKLGLQDSLELGNLNTKVDWGYAGDYVEAMYLMLQQPNPDDFILASGKLHSIADFCQIAFSYLNLDYLKYIGKDKQFYTKKLTKTYVGNPQKAEKVLKWKRQINFEQMVKKMVDYDLHLLKK